MKRFLFLVFVVVSMLLTLKSEPSLTANDPAIESTNQPIKVLDVKLRAANPQLQKVSWLEGLEVQVENISSKPIQYLVIQAEFPVATSGGEPAIVPLVYGHAFADSKSSKVELFQPGAKVTLRASKINCERIRQLVASGYVPSSNEIQPNLNVVLFADKTSWVAGRLHYQDPVNPKKWIAVEELVRSETVNEPFGTSFLKASFKPSSNFQTCYRNVGFQWDLCCTDSIGNEVYIASMILVEDPTGTVHPETQSPCCGLQGGCCTNVVSRPGCAP